MQAYSETGAQVLGWSPAGVLHLDGLNANVRGLRSDDAGASGDGPYTHEVRAVGAGTVTFVLSTDEVDRHGDVVSSDGWRLEAYRRNPVLLWAHDYRRPAIGRAASVWTEPHRLLATVEFAPTRFAQEVGALYASGFQWGVSVGFRPIRWEERRDHRTGAFLGLRYLEQELLEVSAVPVPANRQALRRGDEGNALTPGSSPGQALTLYRGERELSETVALGALLAELENHCLNQDSLD